MPGELQQHTSCSRSPRRIHTDPKGITVTSILDGAPFPSVTMTKASAGLFCFGGFGNETQFHYNEKIMEMLPINLGSFVMNAIV